MEKILKSKEMITRVYKRARILKLVSSGYSVSEAASSVGLHRSTSWRICTNYMKHGLERSLYDSPRSGAPEKFTDKTKAKSSSDDLFPSSKRIEPLDNTSNSRGTQKA